MGKTENKEDPGKNMPGNASKMGPGIPHCFVLNQGGTQKKA